MMLCMIPGDFEKVLPNYKKTGQALSGYSGASLVIGNVNTELYPAWDKYAKTSNEANEDATKLVTGSQQFNEYLEEYKQLPQAGEYKRDLSILQQVLAKVMPSLHSCSVKLLSGLRHAVDTGISLHEFC